MATTTTRRQFLKGMGGVAVGVVVGSGMTGVLTSCSSKAEGTPTSIPPTLPPTAALDVPWPYEKLDPTASAETAYASYYKGGCMYGAFMGIFGELRDKIGSPYDTFPVAMMKYGAAGVAGWGTLCGALNGSAAAIYLVNDKNVGNQIISELFGWYGAETLPNYTPTSPKYAELVSSVAQSQLCHVSVSRWCEESGFKATSPERAERCAWLAASVAKYTAELLNKQTEGTFSTVHAVPAGVQQCLTCHGKGGVKENVHTSKATSCDLCHFGLGTEHP